MSVSGLLATQRRGGRNAANGGQRFSSRTGQDQPMPVALCPAEFFCSKNSTSEINEKEKGQI